MENTTLSPPPQRQDDILTPADSLEAPQQTVSTVEPVPSEVNTLSVDPSQAATTTSSSSASQSESAIVTDLAQDDIVKSRSSLFSNRLFRRVAIVSVALLATIGVMVGVTAATKRVNNWTATPAEQVSQIKEQSVDLNNKLPANASSRLNVRDGVFSFSVDGDVVVTGQLRLVGATNAAQLSTVNLTANRTYLLPNASGTICLDTGNCNGTSNAQLAALGASVTSLLAAGSTATATTNAGVQSLNGLSGTINLQGTPNQITVTDANGVVTFALPQDIAFDSTPIFGGLTLNGLATQNGYEVCDDSNNCGFARGDQAILQGGNSYSTNIIVGASDNYGLSLITNNTIRLSITNNGLITLGGSTTDRIRVLGEISGANALIFQGATDNFFRTTLVVTDPTANRNIILPNADGTICLTSGNCSGAGGYGDILNGGNTFNAAIALGTNDNYGVSLKTFNTTRFNITNTGDISLLGNTAINANAILGASSASRLTLLGQITGGTPLVFQGATDDSFATSFIITDPTANRTIVFPNADGTVCLTSGNCAGTGGSGDILQGGNNFGGTFSIGSNDLFGLELKTDGAPRLTISSTGNAAFSADLIVNGNTTIGDTSTDRVTFNGQITGGIPFVFQGATDNAFATFFTVADPTSNRNIILPNADGTICLSSGNCTTSGGAGDVNNGGNSYNSNMSIGTNDNFSLTFKTDNTDRITISNIGLTTVLANFVVNGDVLLGASSSNVLTLQGSDLFAPNNLNIDTYTQYIDTLNDVVGFGVIPDGSARVNVLSKNGGDALTVNNGTGAGNILNLQDNGVNVVTVTNGGYATFKNTIDNTSAFQIQNAAGNSLLNVDTTRRTININGGPSTYTYTNAGPLFATPVDYGIFAARGMAQGDLNGDNVPDLIYASGASSIYVLINNGDGTFASAVQYTTTGQTVAATIGDFNGDSYKDVALAASSGVMSVFFNNGMGSFGARTDYTPADIPNGITAADFDGDGDLDLATTGGSSPSRVSVFMNNGGSGTFASPVDYVTENSSWSVRAADVDNDNDVDLITLSSNGPLSVFLNNGSGIFGSKTDYTTSAINTPGIDLGDFNGDTFIDIAVSGANTDLVSVLMNTGSGGTFAAKVDYAAGSGSNGVAVGDLNSDGLLDIATGNGSASSVSVLMNQGTGTFAAKVDYSISANPFSIAAADYNGDGKVDLALGAGNNATVMLTVGGSTTVKNSLSVGLANLNDTALFVKAAANQAADLIRVETAGSSNVMFSLSGTGAALFKNETNIATAFQIQDASGSSLLVADTLNNQVKIGGAASSTPTLLVLGLGNDATDPAGTEGAIYYNSLLGKFRCYEAGGWDDCVGGAVAGAIIQGGNSFTEPMTIGTNDSYGLNLEVAGLTVASFDTNGSVLFKNTTDSLTGFQVQNAAGTALFTAVTDSNVIFIGDAPSATPTLLLLGNGNNATDPSGYDGAIYYNSAINRFRCYENGGWKNCITSGGGGGGGDILNGGNSGLGNMIIGNLDNARLDLITNNQVRLRIGAAGNVAIKSTGTIGTVESFRINTPTTVDDAANAIIATGGAANKGLVIQGAGSQTANLQEWQTSTGQLRAAVLASGEFRIYDTAGTEATRFVPGASGSLTVTTTNEGNLTLNPGGALNLGTGNTNAVNIGRVSSDTSIQMRGSTIVLPVTTTVGLTVRGDASQTANLQQWQANGAIILSGVTASGSLFLGQPSGSANPSTGVAQFYNSSGTGVINLQASNPGSGTYTLNLPAENGTLCSTGSVCTGYAAAATNGYVQIAPSSAQTDSTTNATIFLNKTGASGNILQLQKSATNVLTIGNTGAALFQNSTNSTTAFQVQNAAGSSNAFVVDTTNTRVGIGTATPGAALEVGGNILLSQGANRTLSVATNTTTDGNGYNLTIQAGQANGNGTGGNLNLSGGSPGGGLAVSGGINLTTAAAFGASGSINLTTGNGGLSPGTINLQTGINAGSTYSAINVAATGGKVNIGAATNIAKLNIVNDAATPSDIVLLVKGASGQTGVLQAWVDSSGTPVAAVAANGAGVFASLTQNGNAVCDVSGNCPSTLQAVYNASTNPEIVLGSSSNAGLTIRNNATPIAGNLFEIQDNAGTVTYFKADTDGIDVPTGSIKTNGTDRIANDGTLLNVTYNGNTIGAQYGGTGAASFTQYGLLFGNGTGALQSVAVGSSGQCLIGNTGASPTWGSCSAAASGNVNQGGNTFGQGMTIGTIDDYGLTLIADNHAALIFDNEARASFQNKSDATNAFQVQNAAGTSMFNIDTANNRIYVGNATPDSVGVVLVLDTKNTSGDPAGVDGAMYYNSSLAKFRCYEAGEWKDCIYNTRLSTKTSDQTFSSTSYANVNGLSFNVVANSAYRLSCTLLVSVPSGTAGGNLSTTGPASPTQYTATFLKSIDQSSGDNYATSSSYDDTSSATTFRVNTISTGTNRFIVNYNALLVNGGNAGTWQLRAKAVDGSSSITFYANSSCNMQPL